MTFSKPQVPFLFPILAFAFAFTLGAAPVPSAFAQKSRKAHKHGHAKLNIIVEGNNLTAQFESPSEALYGFEHDAKSAAEKTKRDAAMAKLKDEFSGLLVLDAKLGCVFSNTKLETKKAGKHAEVIAEFAAKCTTALAGTSASFAFTRAFPSLKDLEVQVVTGAKQSGAEIKNDKGNVSF